jgi:hypothetical protein
MRRLLLMVFGLSASLLGSCGGDNPATGTLRQPTLGLRVGRYWVGRVAVFDSTGVEVQARRDSSVIIRDSTIGLSRAYVFAVSSLVVSGVGLMETDSGIVELIGREFLPTQYLKFKSPALVGEVYASILAWESFEYHFQGRLVDSAYYIAYSGDSVRCWRYHLKFDPAAPGTDYYIADGLGFVRIESFVLTNAGNRVLRLRWQLIASN